MTNPASGRRRFLRQALAAAATVVQASWATAVASVSATRPIAQVTVNGRGPFPFVFDSAATTSAVSGQLLRELGLEAERGSVVNITGTTGRGLRASVTIDRLECGVLQLRQLQLPLLDRYALPDSDGLLGVAGLSDKRVDIDMVSMRAVVVGMHAVPAAGDWQTLRLQKHPSGLAMIASRVGSVRCMAVIDTGAERSIGNLALANALGVPAAPLTNSTASSILSDASGSTAIVNVVQVPEFALGKARISRGPLALADVALFASLQLESQPALLLGLDRLRTFPRLSLDYSRGRMLVSA